MLYVLCVLCLYVGMFCLRMLCIWMFFMRVCYVCVVCVDVVCMCCVDVDVLCCVCVCMCCLYFDQVGIQVVWRDIWTIYYFFLILFLWLLVFGQDNVLKISFFSAVIMFMKVFQREDGIQNYKFIQILEFILCFLVSDFRVLFSRCSQGSRGARRFYRYVGFFFVFLVRFLEGV